MPAGFQGTVGSSVQIGVPVEHVLLFDHDSGALIQDAAAPMHNKNLSEPTTIHDEA